MNEINKIATERQAVPSEPYKRYQIIIWLTVLLYALPLLLDLAANGWKRVTSYFAADVYYYLIVARNFANYGSFTFDQEFLTNGYHPLWQILLGFFYHIFLVLELSKSSVLMAVFVINVLLLGSAIWLLGKAWILGTRQVSFLFLFLPIGIYGLFIARIIPAYGTLWSFTNGMESSLLIFLYALLFYLSVRYTPLLQSTQALLLGIILSLIFLARLDHVFIPAGWLFFFFLQALFKPSKTSFKNAIFLITPFLMVLGIYLLVNYYFIGSSLPISGIQKSTFPHFDVVGKFNDFSHLLRDNSGTWAIARLWRYWQIVFPATIGLIAALWGIIRLVFTKQLSSLDLTLSASGLSVLLLGLYNLTFVSIWGQGHWYFPVSILFTSLFAIYIGDFLLSRYFPQHNNVFLVFLSVFFVLIFFRFVYWNPDHNQRYAEFLAHSSNILQHYGDELPKLIEFDDGIIGYATDYPTLGGLGFTLDIEAMHAKQEERLLQLAYHRGYRRLASFNYFLAYELDEKSDSAFIAEKLNETHFLTPVETAPFTFSIEYKSEDGRFVIIRMELMEPIASTRPS